MRFYVRRFLHILSFIVFAAAICAEPNLKINELLASADRDPVDNTPKDWIEIYNPTDQRVELTGYILTDDAMGGSRWVFPQAAIEPHAFLLVWASGKNRRVGDEIHTNFALSRSGESVALRDPDGELIDSVYFGRQRVDVSYGRQPDGGESWFYFDEPTPGYDNSSFAYLGFAAKPEFSPAPEIRSESLLVEITCADQDSTITYTLDGSEPTRQSDVYTEPIYLRQTTPIRARAFLPESLPSDILTGTWLIREEIHLPVLSLVTDPENLWNRRTGIYENSTQHGREWERPASVEFFNQDGTQMFGVDAGLRIHGGASRTRSPKRSFRLYFRGDYGPKKLNAPIFPDTDVESFDRLVLRGGFNDTWTYDRAMQRETAIYVSDQVVRDLHNDMGFVAPHGIYAQLYLNGEYWGLYNPCDRIDTDFLASYYNFEDWDIISDDEVKEGDTAAWNDLLSFVRRSNLRDPESYDEVQSMVSLDQITSYYILNIWVQNYDWPHHNWYAARERSPRGLWRFFLWDVEYSFGSGIQGYQIAQNTFETARSAGALGTLFDQLLRNKEYRTYFLSELERYLATTLSTPHVLNRLNEQLEIVRPVIPLEVERWAQDKSLRDWERAADMARDFIENRTPIVRRHIYGAFGMPTPTPVPTPVKVRTWTLY